MDCAIIFLASYRKRIFGAVQVILKFIIETKLSFILPFLVFPILIETLFGKKIIITNFIVAINI